MAGQSGDKASPCCTFLLPNRFHQDEIRQEAFTWIIYFRVAYLWDELRHSYICSDRWMPAVSECPMQSVTLPSS
jgi:hypothetical protein